MVREAVFGAAFMLVAVIAALAAIVQAFDGFPRGRGEIVVLAVAAAVFGTMGLFMLRRGLGAFGRERRLRRVGLPAEGAVVAIAQGDLIINGAPQWVIRYTFVDHRGRTQQGVSPEMPDHEAERWRSGDKGRVLFDRENPSDSMWVGTGA
jgi:hypothetical protein